MTDDEKSWSKAFAFLTYADLREFWTVTRSSVIIRELKNRIKAGEAVEYLKQKGK